MEFYGFFFSFPEHVHHSKKRGGGVEIEDGILGKDKTESQGSKEKGLKKN